MQARECLAFAQVAQHLGTAEILGIVDFDRGSGRSIAIHQRKNPGFVLGRSLSLRLVIQIHDSHRCASVKICLEIYHLFANCQNRFCLWLCAGSAAIQHVRREDFEQQSVERKKLFR